MTIHDSYQCVLLQLFTMRVYESQYVTFVKTAQFNLNTENQPFYNTSHSAKGGKENAH